MTPRRILALGWVVFLLYAYPGYTTSKSLDMLLDARYLELSDWHSPLMSVLWRVVTIAFHGPFGMLLLQSGCLLLGSYVLLARTMPARTAALASAGLLVFPPVMAAVAVIEQDAMLAGFLVAGVALITSEHRGRRIAGLVVMLLACGMREYAWLGVGPFVVLLFVWDAGQRRRVRYPIAIAAWLAAALIAYGLNNQLPTHVTRQNEISLAMFDIAGTLARAQPMTDAEVHRIAAGARFAVVFDVQNTARSLHRASKREIARLFVAPVTDDDVERLLDARARLRAHAPGAYASARWRHWQRILSSSSPRTAVYADDGTTGNKVLELAHNIHHSRVQNALIWFVRLVARTPLFAPFIYLALALAMLPFARRDRLLACLLASGIAIQLALAVVTSDTGYRYSTWPIIATLLAAILVVRHLKNARTESAT